MRPTRSERSSRASWALGRLSHPVSGTGRDPNAAHPAAQKGLSNTRFPAGRPKAAEVVKRISERQSAFEGPENFFPKKFGYTLLNDASGLGFHIRGPGFELRRSCYD